MRSSETKESILNAAIKVFAARGFRDATIRQICSQAGVNVAMVNYHFKNKETLYAEVVRKLFSFATSEEMAALADGITDEKSWKEAVRRFVELFAGYMSVTTEPQVFAARILRWELTRPSSICRELQDAYGATVYEVLKKLLSMALCDDAEGIKIWSAAIWGRLATLAVIDELWLERFKPSSMERSQWVSRIADNECEIIFKSLRYSAASSAPEVIKGETGRSGGEYGY